MPKSTLEKLEEKNKILEKELQTLKDLFQNLNEEKAIESSDQRRAFMLKAQIYQLERQCMLLSQAQSNRASVLTEIECQLQNICEEFQEIIAVDKSGPNVVMKRSRIMEFLGMLKKLKNSLYKQSQLECCDSLRIPSLMSGSKFSDAQKPLDCLDVCKSRGGDLNLKYVANLEQQLSSLYKRLCSFNSSLDISVLSDSPLAGCEEVVPVQTWFLNPVLSRLRDESKECIVDLKHCSDQLVTLSLLHPSAPWFTVLKSKEFDSIGFEKVMQSLPNNVQKNPQTRSVVRDVCKAHNYMMHMQKIKMDAIQAKLQLHQSTAKIQQQYLADLSAIILEDFNKWKEETVSGICEPIARALQSWSLLKDDQSGENLKRFLAEFKKCETELEKAALTESSAHMPVSEDLLSSLRRKLDESLRLVSADCCAKIAQTEQALKGMAQS